MKRVFVVSSLLLVISFTAMAQIFGATHGEEQPAFGASAPSATFHSTSTLPGSGSAYSPNPSLNEDGTASYEGASYSPAKAAGHPGGIKKNPIIEGEGNVPLGDGWLPLMLLLCAYAGYKKVRARSRSANGSQERYRSAKS